MAPGLCALEHLTSLSLCPSTDSSLCGSIEHAPNLKRLKLTSTSRSSLLHSKTLTSLTIGSHNVSPQPHQCLHIPVLVSACAEQKTSEALSFNRGGYCTALHVPTHRSGYKHWRACF